MATVGSAAPLLVLARCSAVVVAALVLVWALLFQTSFLPIPSSQEDFIYAVGSDLLLEICFLFFFSLFF